jgi:hypothetical protein
MMAPVLIFSNRRRSPRRQQEQLPPVVQKVATLLQLRPSAGHTIELVADQLLLECGWRKKGGAR